MALIKISSLGTLASAGNTDVIPIVSGGTTYKITKLAFLTQIQADVDGKLAKSSNLSDLVSASTARDNLGLGSGNSPTFTGLNLSGLTASQLVATDGSKNFQSLTTATYPSLTELSYVKGVTSDIQTQLDAKAPLASPTFTGTPTAPTVAIDTNTTQLATTAWVINQGYQKLAGATTAVASGSLSTGDKVILNSDGTCSVIAGSVYSAGSTTTVGGGKTVRQVMYDSASGNIVVYQSPNGEHNVTVGSVSGTTITFGSTTSVPTGGWVTAGCMCRVGIGSNKIIIASVNYNASNHPGQIVVGTISGTTISFGSSVGFSTGVDTNSGFFAMDWDSTASKAVLVYQAGGTALSASVVTVSGTVPTVNTPVTIASVATAGGYNGQVAYTGTTNKFLLSYADTTNSQGKVCVLTVSGTTLSAGTIATFYAGSVLYVWNAWDATNSLLLIGYQKVSDTSAWVVPVTYSGTTVSVGTPYNVATGTIKPTGVIYDSNSGRSYMTYADGTNHKVAYIKISSGAVADVNNQTITVASDPSYCAGYLTSLANGKLVACMDVGGTGKAIIFNTFYTNLTSKNFLGISTSNYTNGQTATITVLGGTDANQSGLTAGVKYYVNDDGTLGTTNTQPFVGLALTSTRILVKG